MSNITPPTLPSVTFQALPAYVVLEPILEDTPSVFMVDKTANPPKKGRVISIGKSFWDHGVEYTCPVNIGDVVLHTAFGYQDFKVGTVTYRLVRFTDLLVKF